MQDLLFQFSNPLDTRFGRDFFANLPKLPGIYLMYDDHQKLIYVGKAKNLRARLQSYRRVKIGCSSKLLRLVHSVGDIQLEVCESEEKALLRENEMLRTHKPGFNVVNTRPEKHFYFKVRLLSQEREEVNPIELSLTLDGSLYELSEACLFGAYKSMSLCQKTFFALRRMFWMVGRDYDPKQEFRYPLELYRRQKVAPVTLNLSRYWTNELAGFFHGFHTSQSQSVPLVDALRREVAKIAHASLFYQNWFIEDLSTLERFYRSASSRNLRLKRNSNEDLPMISQSVLDDLIVIEKFRVQPS